MTQGIEGTKEHCSNERMMENKLVFCRRCHKEGIKSEDRQG